MLIPLHGVKIAEFVDAKYIIGITEEQFSSLCELLFYLCT